ncbi:hypothetical protein KFE25_008117 [Diacronema lutheri]|uniref:Uncharacterized protein n=1 Tax=Diacronema lutheri TaxID=2081491 RepID=A0A8J5XL05_DIALT|nr:hypothetical protein KFE25_008117 [Diacronema lutheri]
MGAGATSCRSTGEEGKRRSFGMSPGERAEPAPVPNAPPVEIVLANDTPAEGAHAAPEADATLTEGCAAPLALQSVEPSRLSASLAGARALLNDGGPYASSFVDDDPATEDMYRSLIAAELGIPVTPSGSIKSMSAFSSHALDGSLRSGVANSPSARLVAPDAGPSRTQKPAPKGFSGVGAAWMPVTASASLAALS